MTRLPKPRPQTLDTRGLTLEASGLEPLELGIHPKTTGLRPLGQVDGLEQLRPTTAIFPDTQDGVDPKARKQRVATGLNWDSTQ